MKIKCFLFGAAALVLGACSSEEPELPVSIDEAYLQVTVKLPSSEVTRSTTDNEGKTVEGTENGQIYENTISTLQVILEDVEGTSPYAKTVAYSTSGNVPASGVYTYTTEPIKVEGLTGGTVYTAYVIVNGSYDGSDIENAAVEGITAIPGLTVTGSIAEKKKFLMSGFKKLTAATDANTTIYTKDNPLNLGEIEVERLAARLDYRQEKQDNTYDVNPAKPGELLVKLTDMALTNVSPSFYLFKRVSADGTGTGWTLGGKEIGGLTPNYVVDHNWANKTYEKWHSGTKAPFLNAFAGTASATYTSIGSLTEDDNVWSSTEPTYPYGGYKIWTYCTENTIQADPAEPENPNQINGLSTGVIFKGEILTTSTIAKYGKTAPAFNGTDNVYILNRKVYGSWEDIISAKGNSESDILKAFSAGGLSDTEGENAVTDLATAGFTRYTPQNGKYYVYYTYWNRHNDNGKDSEMGPMEFAVVRNNVYKLAVVSISGLGHPNDPTNPGTDPDPDEPDPEDPDEDGSMFLKVSVKVMPWVEGGYGIKL